jgi:quinol monooxygenase YgiN
VYVVAVEFVVEPGRLADFTREIVANAQASRRDEPGCRQFDVCVSTDDRQRIFLYEAYTDRAAFDAHLATAHFAAFNALAAGWTLQKTIRTFERLEP